MSVHLKNFSNTFRSKVINAINARIWVLVLEGFMSAINADREIFMWKRSRALIENKIGKAEIKFEWEGNFILFWTIAATTNMPKTAKSKPSKVFDYLRKYKNEFSTHPTGELYCKVCDSFVNCEKKHNVDSHRNGVKHKDKLGDGNGTGLIQNFIQPPSQPQLKFNENLISTFFAADIPLKKLRHPSVIQ